jgi:hypothetical protein
MNEELATRRLRLLLKYLNRDGGKRCHGVQRGWSD